MSEAGTERVYQDDSYLSTMEAELLRVDTTADGRQILDGTAGLWCCNAGHGYTEIRDAVASRAIPVSSKRPTAVR